MMTSNEFYGGLNRRFDKRAAVLARLGFAYGTLAEAFGVQVKVAGPAAVWYRQRPGRVDVIPATAVQHAANRAWYDLLGATLRRGVVAF